MTEGAALCKEMGAVVATPESWEEADFMATVLRNGKLGLYIILTVQWDVINLYWVNKALCNSQAFPLKINIANLICFLFA